MTQRWLFDLGNSRLKCARLDDQGGLGEVIALGHDEASFAEALRQHLPAQADSAYLASVASPALTLAVIEVLTERFQRISRVRTQAVFAGLRIAYAQPEKLGVDRFLAMVAARARAKHAWLTVGVGTAITVDVLDAQGRHRGGRIAPSPGLMRSALHGAASHLPAQGGHYQEFAEDTDDALASGCEGAALGLIERSLRLATQTLGVRPVLLLHGGGAQALHAGLPEAQWAPSLVLEGLVQWARLGQPADTVV